MLNWKSIISSYWLILLLHKRQGKATGLLFRLLNVAARGLSEDMARRVHDTHGEDAVMRRALHGDLDILGWNMILRLEESEQLVLIIRVIVDELGEVDVALEERRYPVIADLKASALAADVILLTIEGADPGLEGRAEHTEVLAPIAHLFHVAAHDNPLMKAGVARQAAELLIVYNAGTHAGMKALAHTRIAPHEVCGDDAAENRVAEIFEFLIIGRSKGQTIFGALGHRHGPSGLALLGPEVGPVDVGLVYAALLEEGKGSHSAAPIVAPQNAMNVGQLDLLVIRIPGIEDLYDAICRRRHF